MAQSQGQLQAEFQDQVETLRLSAVQAAAAVTAGTQRHWCLLPGPGIAPQDIAGLTQNFDRSGINRNYERLYADPENPGTEGDSMGLSLQATYVAGRERAYRLQACSSVRALVHAACRRQGHGNPVGVLGMDVLRYAQDLLRQGGSPA